MIQPPLLGVVNAASAVLPDTGAPVPQIAAVAALADTLVRVSHLAMHLKGHLVELDINPLMVLTARSGRGCGRRPRRVSRRIMVKS